MNNLIFLFMIIYNLLGVKGGLPGFYIPTLFKVINHTVFEITLSYLHIREYTQTIVMY